MALQINDTAPDFEADTTQGHIRFHDWIGDSWAVLFSHPKDFTPVCTTELGYMANIKPEFDKRGVKIIGLSVDPLANHHGWAKDIKETQGFAPNYPMIADTRPSFTGSVEQVNTIGIVAVAALTASAGGSPPDATITAT